MHALLSGLIGVIGSFIPELIKLWERRGDQRHELRMREIDVRLVQFDIAHRRDEQDNLHQTDLVLQKAAESFGVQLLDAGLDRGLSRCVLYPVFLLFALLDVLNSTVRPVIAYLAFGSYITYRAFNWSGLEDNDWAVLFMILGFFFGNRVIKQSLGGSASTSYRNG